MTNLTILQQRLREEMSKLTPAQLADFNALVDKAHIQAQAILAGNMDGLNGAPKELSLVRSILNPEISLLKTLPSTDVPAYVDPEGNIWGLSTYEQLDPGWAECGVQYLNYLKQIVTMSTNGQLITIDDDVTLALCGDWGTGYWNGSNTAASKIAQLINAVNNGNPPDYTIHLGDTYYSGTSAEMTNNLLNIWPAGSAGTFAIPGNHEMICKEIYYNNILPQLCTLQSGASYFALQNTNWLIICLDSAFYASGDFYADGSILDSNNQGPQADWLTQTILPQAGTRNVIIVTHHQPMDLPGQNILQLFGQVNALLAMYNLAPAYWYFGHEHNGAIYGSDSIIQYPARLIGHGAIPAGVATDLTNSTGTGLPVVWSETQSANDPAYPLRILNGYLYLQLNGSGIQETLYSENGDVRWSSQV
jgi:hypothetical protein